MRAKIAILACVLLVGCSTYLAPQKQLETGFIIGHRYELVLPLLCSRFDDLFTGKVHALKAIPTRTYQGLTIDNRRRKWNRAIQNIQTDSKGVVELPAGTVITVDAVQHPIGESQSDVVIIARIASGPFANVPIDVRDICDAKMGWSDGSEPGMWIYIRNQRFLQEKL